jgi:hypothetical protein
MSFAQYGRCALAGLLAVVTTFAFPRAPAAAGAKQLGHRHPGVHLARAHVASAHGAAATKPKGSLISLGSVAGE